MTFTVNPPPPPAFAIIDNDTSPNYNTSNGTYNNIYGPSTEVFQNIDFTNINASVTTITIRVVTSNATFNDSGAIYATNTANTDVTSRDYTFNVSNGYLASAYPGQSIDNFLAGFSFDPNYIQGTPVLNIFAYSGSSVATGTLLGQSNYTISCFVEGVRIACPGGERPVETLLAGDFVLTASGEARPVRFLGRRVVDLLQEPRAAPVCIPAGAIADGVPSRDLWLSPDHAVVLENVLIPARSLIGGAVQQQGAESVTYYHIQLDTHDVVMAENTPCETLLDSDNPASFDNSDEAVISDAFLAPCLPRVTQGPMLEAARAHIASRTLITA